jgi:signal transduction histidine kinase
MSSLFQPFFTTKEDVGTGLGLWITHNIIEKHGGAIYVKSRTSPAEHGTAFSIFLPLAGANAMTSVASKSVSSGVSSE